MGDAYGLIKPMLQRANPAPGLQDRQTYIPPHIESAMAQHVQQSMPAHLKKYRGGNTYIPEHARAEIAQHLEKTLPGHMKQYAGAYTQQNIIEPSLTRRGAAPVPAGPPAETSSAAVPHAPVAAPDFANLNAVGAAAGQPGATISPEPAGDTQPAPPAQAPVPAGPVDPAAAAPTGRDAPYAFITNPAPVSKPPLLDSLPGAGSMIGRVGLIIGGAIALLIVFTLLRGVLSNKPKLTAAVNVVQEQQELIHLAANAAQQDGLSVANQNLSATVQASLISSQLSTIQYLTTNKQKISDKQLGLKVSAATDTQLAGAASAGTYNQTYHDVMKDKITEYMNSLSAAYKQSTGPKGRTLMQDSYNQAKLFTVQLDPPAN
jgi:hypothetical protein